MVSRLWAWVRGRHRTGGPAGVGPAGVGPAGVGPTERTRIYEDKPNRIAVELRELSFRDMLTMPTPGTDKFMPWVSKHWVTRLWDNGQEVGFLDSPPRLVLPLIYRAVDGYLGKKP